MDLMKAMAVSAGGMQAQSTRIKMITENIANADSVISQEGGAYRRKQIFFRAELDRATGMTHVKVDKIQRDYKTELKQIYDPSNPLADERGFVAYPNVDTLTENMDLREAARMYEANMRAIDAVKEISSRTMDLLR
jgi:flagellar basal-body rod protein FlgC